MDPRIRHPGFRQPGFGETVHFYDGADVETPPEYDGWSPDQKNEWLHATGVQHQGFDYYLEGQERPIQLPAAWSTMSKDDQRAWIAQSYLTPVQASQLEDEAGLTGGPPGAAGIGSQIADFVKKNPVAVGLGAVLVVILAAGGGAEGARRYYR
jgi:hypothetical protein